MSDMIKKYLDNRDFKLSEAFSLFTFPINTYVCVCVYTFLWNNNWKIVGKSKAFTIQEKSNRLTTKEMPKTESYLIFCLFSFHFSTELNIFSLFIYVCVCVWTIKEKPTSFHETNIKNHLLFTCGSGQVKIDEENKKTMRSLETFFA